MEAATSDSAVETLARMHYFFDTAFPTGAYAHSFGFESFAVGGGPVTVEGTARWIREFVAFALWPADLEVISRTLEAGWAGVESGALLAIDRRLHASRSTAEGRLAATRLAASIRSAASQAYRDLHLPEEVGLLREPASAVGVVAMALGWPALQTRLLYLVSQVVSLASVPVRLGRLGQSGQLQVVEILTADCAKLAVERPGGAQPAAPAFNWTIEGDQIRHVALSPRLYQS